MNDRVIFLEPGQVKRGWERFSHQTEDDDYYNDAMGDFGPIGRELRARYRASCATGGCGARGGGGRCGEPCAFWWDAPPSR